MGKLDGIAPERVFHYFEEISAIPRGSGNTEGIRSYLEEFAKAQNLRYIKDEGGNIILFAPGSEGYESSAPVILQGHMDMVCQKSAEVEHDFTKDPLELMTDGEYIFANGTTLGADDGIALAYILAILSDDSIAHPPIEAVITTDEEIGLLGADKLDCGVLTARRMINLDSESEGVFTCGCAGGVRVDIALPIERIRQKGLPVQITVDGLRGGHSGQMIDTYRANADKVIARFLYALGNETSYSLESIAGGDKDNAIPQAAKANIVIDAEDYPIVVTFAEKYQADLRNEFSGIDDQIAIHTAKGNVHKINVMTPESQDKALFLLMHSPYGVRKMSGAIEGLVETSSNLGIVRTGEKEFACTTSLRSSVFSARKALEDELDSLTRMVGATIRFVGAYPAWEFNEESALRDTMMDAYEEMKGEEPLIDVIHAGLECGLFYERMPGLDAVSMGPDMYDIHTFKEKLSIASAKRTFELLLNVLARLK